MSPEIRQLMDLHLGRTSRHNIIPLEENTKFGTALNNDERGVPPTVFIKAYKGDFRGMFRIVVRDALQGPEVAKKKDNIFSLSIHYVFHHVKKGH